MHISKVTLLIILSLLASFSFAGRRIVYGSDDRLDFYEVSSKLQKLSHSVGGIFSIDKSLQIEGNRTLLEPKTLGRKLNLCKGENFIKQASTVHCTFFLVAKDLVVTAGHCMKEKSSCSSSRFLFDYKISGINKKADMLVDNKSVYKCKEIVSIGNKSIDDKPVVDYALVRLDRDVIDREPLKYRYQGFAKKEIPMFSSPEVGESVSVIGHPSGLPLKFVSGSKVTQVPNKYYFVTNLDTFGGNSGSPVFDTKTSEVVGILVRGQKDYVYDEVRKCSQVNKLKSVKELPLKRTNRGESVSNIYQIKELYK